MRNLMNIQHRADMQAKGIIWCAAVLATFCWSMSFADQKSPLEDRPHAGNEGFIVPANDIPGLQISAMRGSGKSAYRLSQYYYFVALDEAKGHEWLVFAAENGDPTAEYSLGKRLSEKDDRLSRVRACFWLERASKHGDELVIKLAKQDLFMQSRECGGGKEN